MQVKNIGLQLTETSVGPGLVAGTQQTRAREDQEHSKPGRTETFPDTFCSKQVEVLEHFLGRKLPLEQLVLLIEVNGPLRTKVELGLLVRVHEAIRG